MKLILLTFFAVLSSGGCSSGDNMNGTNGKVGTQFESLNDDVLYITFHMLEWDDLVSLVQINLRFEFIAREVVRRKYKQINQLRMRCTEYKMDSQIVAIRDQIEIYNMQLAMDMLKYFGGHFAMIKVEYYNDLTKINLISQCLNEYCSKSLKNLDLTVTEDFNILETFTKPFDAVEELNIHSSIDEFSETIQLNELFPKLKRLTLGSDKAVNYSFIRSEFPNLEHFSFYVNNLRDVTNNENVRELIRKNPTIRSIQPQVRDRTLINFISKHLPNIESLTIFDLGNDAIHFEKMKSLSLLMPTIDSIDKISVPQLDSLKIRLELRNYNKFMNFLNNCTQLRHLHVTDMTMTSLREFNVDARFASLTNLTDVTFDVSIHYLHADPIIQFIENRTKLNRCTFLGSLIQTSDLQVLRERLGSEWKIEFTQTDKCLTASFERKKPVLE